MRRKIASRWVGGVTSVKIYAPGTRRGLRLALGRAELKANCALDYEKETEGGKGAFALP